MAKANNQTRPMGDTYKRVTYAGGYSIRKLPTKMDTIRVALIIIAIAVYIVAVWYGIYWVVSSA